MKATFTYGTGTLVFTDDEGALLRSISAFSRVRNELNGGRPLPFKPDDVEHSETEDGSQGLPVMPRDFPRGSWTITGIEATNEMWLKPWKLITDAHQELDVYKLDAGGCYAGKSGQKVEDYGYRIHFCNGSTHTDGCIGQENAADILWCKVNLTFPIPLEVVD